MENMSTCVRRQALNVTMWISETESKVFLLAMFKTFANIELKIHIKSFHSLFHVNLLKSFVKKKIQKEN